MKRTRYTKQPPDARRENPTGTRGEACERCVICGALTDVPVSTPVDWRKNYVPGCDQLCAGCALTPAWAPGWLNER